MEKILDKAYVKALAAKINMDKAQEYAPTEGIEAKSYPGCTSHFSVMDRFGNVVVQKQTVRNCWNSGVAVPGRGFVMNNAMAGFSPKVGVRTTQGPAYDDQCHSSGQNSVAQYFSHHSQERRRTVFGGGLRRRSADYHQYLAADRQHS